MNTFETPKNASKNGKPARGKKANGGTASNGVRPPAPAAPSLDHRQVLSALRAFKRGDFSVKMRDDLVGVDGQIAETFNEIVELVKTIRDEASDVSGSVGKQGQAAKRREEKRSWQHKCLRWI